MPNVFTLIGSSWDFYKKQPVLNSIVLWMLVVPLVVMSMVEYAMDMMADSVPHFIEMYGAHALVTMVLIIVAMYIIVLWGTAAVLIVGKRLMQNKAGRSRTSFTAVRSSSAKLITNILITGILRTCFTVFWSLLLIVPGIIYSIRTTFYHIAIACEGKEYRSALKRSQELVKGHTWQVLFYLIGMSLIIFVPISLITFIVAGIISVLDDRYLLIADILNAAMQGFAMTIFTLASVSLYASLKKLKA